LPLCTGEVLLLRAVNLTDDLADAAKHVSGA
jgi:hypothetical protein